jgi:hypothetical protein
MTEEGLAQLLDATIIPEQGSSSESTAPNTEEGKTADKLVDRLKKDHAHELHNLTEQIAGLQEKISGLKEQLKGANKLYKIEVSNTERLREERKELEDLLKTKTERSEADNMSLRARLRLAEELQGVAENDNREYELRVEDLQLAIAVRDAMIKCITKKYEDWGSPNRPKLSKLTLAEAESLRKTALDGMREGTGHELSPTMKKTLDEQLKLVERHYVGDGAAGGPDDPQANAQNTPGTAHRNYVEFIMPDGTIVKAILREPSEAAERSPHNEHELTETGGTEGDYPAELSGGAAPNQPTQNPTDGDTSSKANTLQVGGGCPRGEDESDTGIEFVVVGAEETAERTTPETAEEGAVIETTEEPLAGVSDDVKVEEDAPEQSDPTYE